MKDELTVRFCKAFFGGGTDHERCQVAFEVSDYYEAFGRYDVAHLYERIAEFYCRESLKNARDT
jgi:hypothetical protein